MTLRRWYELECGDSNDGASWAIERGENGDGPPYRVVHYYGPGKYRKQRFPVPDRETGAKKRLAAIMARYPDLVPFVQTDPRGGSLYLVPREKVGEPGTSKGIDCVYSSRGTYCNYG